MNKCFKKSSAMKKFDGNEILQMLGLVESSVELGYCLRE